MLCTAYFTVLCATSRVLYRGDCAVVFTQHGVQVAVVMICLIAPVQQKDAIKPMESPVE